jgi:hypothetical protein
MKPVVCLSGIGGLMMLGCALVTGASPTSSPTAVPQYGLGGLPGRATATPEMAATPTPGPTLQTTSPFVFPTPPPGVQPTPSQDCTAVFSLDSIETIDFGHTTVIQLEAAFGHPTYRGGRPTRFRFEDEGCILLVTIGAQGAEEAELLSYGTLGLLLDRYGLPAAVGISAGSMALPMVGYTGLFYPERGITAIFDSSPDALRLTTPINTLQFQLPYVIDKQFTRLNVHPVNWQPPVY